MNISKAVWIATNFTTHRESRFIIHSWAVFMHYITTQNTLTWSTSHFFIFLWHLTLNPKGRICRYCRCCMKEELHVWKIRMLENAVESVFPMQTTFYFFLPSSVKTECQECCLSSFFYDGISRILELIISVFLILYAEGFWNRAVIYCARLERFHCILATLKFAPAFKIFVFNVIEGYAGLFCFVAMSLFCVSVGWRKKSEFETLTLEFSRRSDRKKSPSSSHVFFHGSIDFLYLFKLWLTAL